MLTNAPSQRLKQGIVAGVEAAQQAGQQAGTHAESPLPRPACLQGAQQRRVHVQRQQGVHNLDGVLLEDQAGIQVSGLGAHLRGRGEAGEGGDGVRGEEVAAPRQGCNDAARERWACNGL